MAPRGVIFDLDGTLYRMPWYFKPVFYVRLFPRGGRLPAYMSVRDSFAGKDMGEREALLAALSAELGRRVGAGSSEAREWIENRFYPGFVEMMGMVRGSRRGVSELLGALRAADARIGVLSDFGRVDERLRALGINGALFDTLESSEGAGALKPSARPFLSMARSWGIPPAGVLVVGDRDDTDGAAARAAGMQFLQVRGTQGCDWEQACERVRAWGSGTGR